jgi:protein MBA1
MTIYPIPGAEDRNGPTALRQVVLRLKTRQRLTIERKPEDRKSTPKGPGRRLAWTPDGVQPEVKKGVQVPEVETHENDVVEYILMQQRMLKGQEEEWKVWGFVNRTTLESIAEDEKFIEQNELWQQQQRQAQGAVAAA